MPTHRSDTPSEKNRDPRPAPGGGPAVDLHGQVQRVLPNGTCSMLVHLPSSNVTCRTMGRKDMEDVFIATARISMNDA